jgi:hypothetical protein
MWRAVAALGFALGLACLAQAQSPVQYLLLYQSNHSTTTWNPSDKAASIALSNGNLTASASTNNSDEMVRSVTSYSSGKYFFQTTGSSCCGAGLHQIGFANSTQVLTGNFLGSSTNGFGFTSNNGVVYCNGGISATYVTWTTSTLSVAFDITNVLVWFRVGSGNWNNNAGADPVTGTGGLSLAGTGCNGTPLAAGPYFAIYNFEDLSGVTTTNFGATSYSPAAPAGFSNL